jgi:hypothetical protein
MLVSRKFRSSPYRDSAETWSVIVDFLARQNNSAKAELNSVAAIAGSCIADQAMKTAPITVSCDGRQIRIYCLYDEESLDQSDFNETVLGFDPLKGSWQISLPCSKDDLIWVQGALSKLTSRITARDFTLRIADEERSSDMSAEEMTINLEGFLKQ